LIEALKKDGLAKGDDIKLAINNGKITINGTELTADVASKYAMYIDAKEGVKIAINETEKKQ
jgi:hypothetical protein